MTTLTAQLDEKQKVASGLLTQAKGVAEEQWGKLTNNEQAQLAGKKDQLAGRLQATYGDSWLARNKGWLTMGTAVAVLSMVLAFIIARNINTD